MTTFFQIAMIPLQTETEVEKASSTLMQNAITATVVLVIGAIVLWIWLKWSKSGRARGDEFKPMTLKRLHDEGQLSDEEYASVKQSMTKRLIEELEEGKRLEEERRLAKDPIAAIAANAKREQEEQEFSDEAPPPPPPPPPPLA